MTDKTTTDVQSVDPRQLARIESVHRGFLYQHLYAAACLLMAKHSGMISLFVEKDEDVEIVFPNRRIYIQIKTRSRQLMYIDIEGAIERFEILRLKHASGERLSTAQFIIISNTQPNNALLQRMSETSWPSDLQIYWPDGPTSCPEIPIPFHGIDEAFAFSTELASKLLYTLLAPETLVWKLAGVIMLASTGSQPYATHCFHTEELTHIFEQLIIQLHDFPDPPVVYRPQVDEPTLISFARVRIIVGYSGAGKTSWVSQAVTHTINRVIYFDVSDTSGAALSSALARELVARLFNRTTDLIGEILLPGASGNDILHIINSRLNSEKKDVTIVLDNSHSVEVTAIQNVISQCGNIKFILICQPSENVRELEAVLNVESEQLLGWAADTIALEACSCGCRGDLEACQHLVDLTAGMPLYVQNALTITRKEYSGDIARFCEDLEAREHVEETAQEIILKRVFGRLPRDIQNAIGVLSLTDIPLEKEHAIFMLINVLNIERKFATTLLRQLRSNVIIEAFGGERFKIHDAMRLLGKTHLEILGTEIVRKTQETLKNIIYDSLQHEFDMPKILLYLRLIAETGDIKTLVHLTEEDLFYEIGVTSEIMKFLETASISINVEPENRFWALDALVNANLKKGEFKVALKKHEMMARLIEEYHLGDTECLAFAMKSVNIAACEGNRNSFETSLSEASKLLPRNPIHQRIFRYNVAHAFFNLCDYKVAINETLKLVQEYYELLSIDPITIFGKNVDKIWPLIKKDDNTLSNLKHLGDCLDLYAKSMNSAKQNSGLARIHAMKFYEMSKALESLVRVGQDLADEFVSRNDFIGARDVLEKNLLPIVARYKLFSKIIATRSQYAVVLAYCGDFKAANDEVKKLEPYENGFSVIRKLEFQKQRMLIADICKNGPPKQWEPAGNIVKPAEYRRIGRNDICPCGSGKKFKKCHGLNL